MEDRILVKVIDESAKAGVGEENDQDDNEDEDEDEEGLTGERKERVRGGQIVSALEWPPLRRVGTNFELEQTFAFIKTTSVLDTKSD